MTDPLNDLSERRKRGTGLSERTSVSLSPRARNIILVNKINLSAWVDKKLVNEFGGSEDPVLNKMKMKLEQLCEERERVDQECRILAISITSRASMEKPLPEPDFDSTAAQNAIFQSDMAAYEAQREQERKKGSRD